MRLLFGLLILLLPGLAAADGPPPITAALLKELQQGGFVIYFRHGETPNYRDPEPGGGENCSVQRNLSVEGREMARKIGLAFRELEIPIGIVRASPYCRTMDTARLAFGRAESDAWLRTSGDDNDPEEKKRMALQRSMARIRPLPGTNTILVGHGNGVVALGLGHHPMEGEAAIVKPTGDGITFVVGVKPGEWVRP